MQMEPALEFEKELELKVTQDDFTPDSGENNWWHEIMDSFAAQLPLSVLQQMKDRILNSKVGKTKFELTDDSEDMKSFCMKENKRYTKKLKKQRHINRKKCSNSS